MIKSPERVTVTGALPGLFFRIMADANKPSGFAFFKFLDNSPALPESLPSLTEAEKQSRKAECSARTGIQTRVRS